MQVCAVKRKGIKAERLRDSGCCSQAGKRGRQREARRWGTQCAAIDEVHFLGRRVEVVERLPQNALYMTSSRGGNGRECECVMDISQPRRQKGFFWRDEVKQKCNSTLLSGTLLARVV